MDFLKRTCFFAAICLLALLTYTCTDSSTGTNGEPPSGSDFNSQAGPGSSAELFLNGDQYSNLTIEIDYMPGHQPTQSGLDSLKSFLEKRLNKTTISFRTPSEIESGGQSAYTAGDVRSIEESNRDFFTESDGNTLQAYFLVLDGEYEQSNVLGIAYWNTSVAFFGQTIEDVSSGVGAPPEEKIEGTVFRHEFGHNMGLVGNGTPTQSNHKTDGSAHCTEDGCLMEPAVETGNFFSNTFDGDIPDLDPLCIEDLQANGGK